MKIREVMKSPVVSVKPRNTVRTALEIMERENVNGTPIVDDDNHLLGIIVKADIYRFLIDPGHYDTCPVEWLMTKEVVKVDADETVLEAAKQLKKHDIIALPVLENDILVGMISLEDFLVLYVDHFA